jgi:hypothetical protein
MLESIKQSVYEANMPQYGLVTFAWAMSRTMITVRRQMKTVRQYTDCLTVWY